MKQLVVNEESDFDACYGKVSDLEQAVASQELVWNNTSAVLLSSPRVCKLFDHADLDGYMTLEFLNSLQSISELTRKGPLRFYSKRRQTVAVHVRRGDIPQKEPIGTNNPVIKARWRPDEEYLEQIARVLERIPRAEVHIFSTTEGQDPAIFEAYRARGFSLHLDGDILEDWAHMSQADVFIMAPSTFSVVAGMLNRKCVFYPHFTCGPLKHWFNMDNGSTAELDACLARAFP